MATGSFSYEVVGAWQDITDIVVMISPDDTPFLTMFGNEAAEATTITSLNDALPVPDSTPILEGSDVTTGAVLANSKVDNYVQIFDAKFYLTDTQIAIKKHGVPDEVAKQIEKHTTAIGMNMEKAIVTHDTAVAGANGTAPKMGGIPYFNVSNATATAVFSETKFNDAAIASWTKGGKPSLCALSMANKRIANTFNAGGNKNRDQKDKTVIVPVDFYESDAGKIKWMPHRMMASSRVEILDPQYFKCRFLIPFHMEPLAKVGHKENYLITGQASLECGSKEAQASLTGIQ